MPSVKSSLRHQKRDQPEVVRLSPADQKRFAEALLSPPKPAPALKRAFAGRRKLLGV